MSKYEIIDNALDINIFNTLKDKIFNSDFAWYYNDGFVANHDKETYFYTHWIYKDHTILSDFYYDILPILNLLNVKSLIRIRINSTLNLNIKHQVEFHTDAPFEHKGALFYLNTTNGSTLLEDKTEIECIKNRLLKFDSSKPHAFNFQTDEQRRIVINFNYF